VGAVREFTNLVANLVVEGVGAVVASDLSRQWFKAVVMEKVAITVPCLSLSSIPGEDGMRRKWYISFRSERLHGCLKDFCLK